MKNLTCLCLALLATQGNFAWGNAPASETAKPAGTRIDHSKLLGFVVTDANGKFLCGGSATGAATGLPPCSPSRMSLVEAGRPQGVSVETKTAFLPALLIGLGAATCFTGGAVVGVSVLQKLQGDKNAKVSETLGRMNYGLVPIIVGKIITPWVAGNLGMGITESAIAWSAGICGVSAMSGAATAVAGVEIVYYVFARQKSDFGHAH